MSITLWALEQCGFDRSWDIVIYIFNSSRHCGYVSIFCWFVSIHWAFRSLLEQTGLVTLVCIVDLWKCVYILWSLFPYTVLKCPAHCGIETPCDRQVFGNCILLNCPRHCGYVSYVLLVCVHTLGFEITLGADRSCDIGIYCWFVLDTVGMCLYFVGFVCINCQHTVGLGTMCDRQVLGHCYILLNTMG